MVDGVCKPAPSTSEAVVVIYASTVLITKGHRTSDVHRVSLTRHRSTAQLKADLVR